ncbi:MAG: hypothetical protein H7242_12435 [Microbacteriaceae bacterium]|nr:hypothetical protein [Burkholderiaceae bacterium]
MTQHSKIKVHLAVSPGIETPINYGPSGLQIEVAMAFGLDHLFIDTDNPA